MPVTGCLTKPICRSYKLEFSLSIIWFSGTELKSRVFSDTYLYSLRHLTGPCNLKKKKDFLSVGVSMNVLHDFTYF